MLSKKTKKTKNPKPQTKPQTRSQVKPEVGNKVEIAIKPYKGKTAIGIVKKVLTKKKYHSRGHKVMLNSDKVGRVIRIIQKITNKNNISKTEVTKPKPKPKPKTLILTRVKKSKLKPNTLTLKRVEKS